MDRLINICDKDIDLFNEIVQEVEYKILNLTIQKKLMKLHEDTLLQV